MVEEPEELENTRFYLEYENSCNLATNATHDLFPREFEFCESDMEEEKIIKEMQENNNFYIEDPTDIDNTIILCDIDGDGTSEKLIISNVSFDKAFYWEDTSYNNDKGYEICATFSGDGEMKGVLDKVNDEWQLVMRSCVAW